MGWLPRFSTLRGIIWIWTWRTLHPWRILHAPGAISVHCSFRQASLEPGPSSQERRTLSTLSNTTVSHHECVFWTSNRSLMLFWSAWISIFKETFYSLFNFQFNFLPSITSFSLHQNLLFRIYEDLDKVTTMQTIAAFCVTLQCLYLKRSFIQFEHVHFCLTF